MKSKDIFVLSLNSRLFKDNITMDDDSTLTVKYINPAVIIFNQVTKSTPWWIIIAGACLGILILALLTFILYKVVFFKFF